MEEYSCKAEGWCIVTHQVSQEINCVCIPKEQTCQKHYIVFGLHHLTGLFFCEGVTRHTVIIQGCSISMRWGPPAVSAWWKMSLSRLRKATERKRVGEKWARESPLWSFGLQRLVWHSQQPLLTTNMHNLGAPYTISLFLPVLSIFCLFPGLHSSSPCFF